MTIEPLRPPGPEPGAVTIALARADMTGAEMRAIWPAGEDGYESVTNTAGLSLLARASTRIGVDAEPVRTRVLLDRLARRAMTDPEHEAWLEEHDRNLAFLRHWTRTEAYLKAIGTGVRGGLRSRPGPGWTVIELDVGPDHIAALAVECTPAPVVHWLDA
jgi:4'-phosphopantetheinyl transferase